MTFVLVTSSGLTSQADLGSEGPKIGNMSVSDQIAAARLARMKSAKFGPEWEFTKSEMRGRPGFGLKETEAQQQVEFAQAVEVKCRVRRDCRVDLRFDGKRSKEYRVTFDDGAWFQISYDPNVVEIIAQPATMSEWESRKEKFEDLIFDTAKGLGLTADREFRAGHLNFGFLSTFASDTDLFLRFFADFTLHPELAAGIFRKNFLNSPPLAALQFEQLAALENIIGHFANDGHMMSIPELAQLIQTEVYTETFNTELEKAAYHYQAMGLKSVVAKGERASVWSLFVPFLNSVKMVDQPIEIRSMRAQESVAEFIALSKLILARIDYLDYMRTLGAPLPSKFTQVHRKMLGLSDRELVQTWETYLNECGLRLEDYKFVLSTSARDVADAYSTARAESAQAMNLRKERSLVRCEDLSRGFDSALGF